jgi:uncharacterized protein (DUF2236 family)
MPASAQTAPAPAPQRPRFTEPVGEPALVPAGSVTWRVFRNPIATYIGGITAVILELAEPRVCSGVWDHTTFRTDPLRRLRRTGLAAMMTVYGARSEAERMIAGVRRMHGRVSGVSADGQAYNANDTELLDWVQATASFGFLEAYAAYAAPLSQPQRDAFYAESATPARAYGAVSAPTSQTALDALFAAMQPKLQPTPVIFEFFDLMLKTPVFPRPLRGLQRVLLHAAVQLVPATLRQQLRIGREWELRHWERPIVRVAAWLADRWTPRNHPMIEACQRLGLNPKTLFANDSTQPRQLQA